MSTDPRVADLIGPALDDAVAKLAGIKGLIYPGLQPCFPMGQGDWVPYSPSTMWVHGGPIIERERINLSCVWDPGSIIRGAPRARWMARFPLGEPEDDLGLVFIADTPLVAAMRAYVLGASKKVGA